MEKLLTTSQLHTHTHKHTEVQCEKVEENGYRLCVCVFEGAHNVALWFAARRLSFSKYEVYSGCARKWMSCGCYDDTTTNETMKCSSEPPEPSPSEQTQISLSRSPAFFRSQMCDVGDAHTKRERIAHTHTHTPTPQQRNKCEIIHEWTKPHTVCFTQIRARHPYVYKLKYLEKTYKKKTRYKNYVRNSDPPRFLEGRWVIEIVKKKHLDYIRFIEDSTFIILNILN